MVQKKIQFSANTSLYFEKKNFTWKVNYRKSEVSDRSVSVTMTLSDLEKRKARSQVFPVDLHRYVRAVLPAASKPRRERAMFVGSGTLPPLGTGSSASKVLGTPLMATRFDLERPNSV